ncbi:MAG: phage tail sheath subtilisin-like domain-containing protein [Vicinamibacterales bacterium]
MNASSPGLRFEIVAPPGVPSPLRSDIAGFAGSTWRGPVGTLTRVTGWREYQRLFGGVVSDAITPYSARGYFLNGGDVAHVFRLLGPQATTAFGVWTIGIRDAAAAGGWSAASPSVHGFLGQEYAVSASSPGRWANGTTIAFAYRLRGARGPEVDVTIVPPYEPPEYFTNLATGEVHTVLNAQSAYVRVSPLGPAPSPPGASPGPSHVDYSPTVLQSGADDPPSHAEYLAATVALGDEPEVALVAAPDIFTHLATGTSGTLANRTDAAIEVLSGLIAQAERLHDRLVLVDLPPEGDTPVPASDLVAWITSVGSRAQDKCPSVARVWRAAAAYHPPIQIPDASGGIAHPLRTLPPSGHVGGAISRLDRERGAHYTPANTVLLEAVDLTDAFDDGEERLLRDAGVNLLCCSPGRGLQVWGGRTLQIVDADGGAPVPIFLAHRRLIHRLVRAIRRVAEPLVFDTNGPHLWLTLVRAITAVLLEAFRAGALKGEREDEAFRVQCDETTNPPEAIDNGLCTCLIEFAPAMPMEFIVLRVGLSRDGSIELVES